MSVVVSFHIGTFRRRAMLSRLVAIPADRWELSQTPGLRMGKMFGTSARNTTTVSADLSRWAIFAIWENADSLYAFLDDSALTERWRRTSVSIEHRVMTPLTSSGTWGGTNPLADTNVERAPFEGDIAVVTRASIRWRTWLRFARAIGAVDGELHQHEGCTLAMGIGEWPVGEQATFSVWNSADAIEAFAYRGSAHSAVIRRTHREKWFNEMYFARFGIEKKWTETKKAG